jgi:type IV pilus assembly protein PilC
MHFKYTVYNRENKVSKGSLTAADQEAAVTLLEQAGYRILSLHQSRTIAIEEVLPSLFTVKKSDVIMFSRRLAMLMGKGIRFLVALRLVREQVRNRLFRKRIDAMIAAVESGSAFSESVAVYPDIFPKVYHNMMRIGEKTGQLENVLAEVAKNMEDEDASFKKIRSAFIYPGVILCMGIVTVIIMITTVLPSMSDLFSRFNAELPLPTRITLAVSQFLTDNWLYLLGGILAAGLALIWYSRTASGKYYLEKVILAVPVIGRLLFLRNLQQFSRVIVILFSAGISITEVFETAELGVSSEIIRRELRKIPRSLSQGYGLAQSMHESSVFPSMLIQMVVSGEETNTLESSFQALSAHYDFEFNQSLATFTSLLQPVLIAVVGLLIGFVAISAMLPMYSMFDVIF